MKKTILNKTTPTNLLLRRETVRNLSADELVEVAGGGMTYLRCTVSVTCTIPTTSSTCPKSE